MNLADAPAQSLPKPKNPPERIGLTLSGGGLRATLFHLGVVRLLFERGFLPRVEFIGGVSGGSILAMHLGLNWNLYCGDEKTFEVAAREVVAFCRLDVRNRILRRWLFGWVTIIPRVVLGWSRIHLLASTYKKLFGEATLGDLLPPLGTKRPRIIAQSVSLTTGQPCSFGRSGFMWYEADEQGFLHEHEVSKLTPHIPVALAVAASSAFPPMFPPLPITAQLLHVGLDEFSHPQYVTDGGVYDNLGIERPLWHYEQHRELDAFIVSDAGGTFNWDLGRFGFALPRNVRATNVLMKRVGDLISQRLSERGKHVFVQLHIASTTNSLDDGTLPPAVQRCLCRIRTDLDGFTDVEIDSLVRHGYAVARKQLIAQGWLLEEAPHCRWSPVGVTRLNAGPWAASLEKSVKLRFAPLFSIRDWPIWAVALIVIGIVLAIRFFN